MRRIVRPGWTLLELGTWLGLSTRHMLVECRAARIVCVDHWLGSPELAADHGHLFGLPAYEAFLHYNWEFRERIVPVRLSTADGLEACARAGLAPDAVYVDAAHDRESVERDTLDVLARFPGAAVFGDDWDSYGVADGVRAAVDARPDVACRDNGKAWWLERSDG